MTSSSSQPRFTLPRSHRLRGRRAFGAVFAARIRKQVGPLWLHGRVNGLAFTRLGISIGRRCGNAVVRNRVKRLLREAFRLGQHDWPQGYDLVIVVRPHETKTLDDYQRMLAEGMTRLARECDRHDERKRRNAERPTS